MGSSSSRRRQLGDDDGGSGAPGSGPRDKGGNGAGGRSGDNRTGDCCGGIQKRWFNEQTAAKRTGGDPKTPLRITIGYWRFRGLGAPMRMMCAYAGINYDEEQFEVRSKKNSGGWCCPEYDQRRSELARSNPLAQLPWVSNHTTGEVMCGINAVYLYLGRILHLDGRSAQSKTQNEQILFFMLGTLWLEYGDFVYPFKKNDSEQTFKRALDFYFTTIIPGHYGKLEAWLKLHNQAFFAGTEPAACDFHVWEFMDHHESMARSHRFRSPLADVPLLGEFYKNFSTQPKLSKYFESANFKLPMNNKMAFF